MTVVVFICSCYDKTHQFGAGIFVRKRLKDSVIKIKQLNYELNVWNKISLLFVHMHPQKIRMNRRMMNCIIILKIRVYSACSWGYKFFNSDFNTETGNEYFDVFSWPQGLHDKSNDNKFNLVAFAKF